MKTIAKHVFISCGCNRTYKAIDWGLNGLISFGACNSVAIYRPSCNSNHSASIISLLNGHKARINCVKWIQNCETFLISGSVDGCVIVWSNASENQEFSELQCLKTCSEPVTCLDAVKMLSGCVVMVTGSADNKVKIWLSNQASIEFVEHQTICLGSHFALTIAVLSSTQSDLMVAVGKTDHSIDLLYCTSPDHALMSVVKLKGHEDWIMSVSFTMCDDDILLASASKDCYVRVWRISSMTGEPHDAIGTLVKGDYFTDESGNKYRVAIETVLAGHNGWVSSVAWQRVTHGNVTLPYLLSTSMDKTIIVWKPSEKDGVWVDQVRVGEVGGNTLGFYQGVFSPTGDSVMAVGYQGSLHQWNLSQDMSSCRPVVTVKGHFDGVQDIAWEKRSGQYLVSVSLDQTCRLFAPWDEDNMKMGWYEVGRPQIHGYDIQCLTLVSGFSFASGADEKVIRVFEASSDFITNFNLITKSEDQLKISDIHNRPKYASVPVLGLSNKAVLSEDSPSTARSSSSSTFRDLAEPPPEEYLLQSSLWPESHKLYGHPYEIFSLACDPSGLILASACKATKPEYAKIFLWDATSWLQIDTLDGPSLTVTQMEFSNNGQLLLAVSRDRTWHLYRKCYRVANTENEGETAHSDKWFELLACLNKKTSIHGRIIWSCCWSHDDVYFVTASRDKKVILWKCEDQGLNTQTNHPCAPPLIMIDAATAVAMAPCNCYGQYVLAVGLDCGTIILNSWSHGDEWTCLFSFDKHMAHSLTVKRLTFRPLFDQSQKFSLDLASCSSDHSVRIYNINLMPDVS